MNNRDKILANKNTHKHTSTQTHNIRCTERSARYRFMLQVDPKIRGGEGRGGSYNKYQFLRSQAFDIKTFFYYDNNFEMPRVFTIVPASIAILTGLTKLLLDRVN